MNFKEMSEDELLNVDRTLLTDKQKDAYRTFLIRNVLWQDIVAKRDDRRMLAIDICRYQDGWGLGEAANEVDAEYYRIKKERRNA